MKLSPITNLPEEQPSLQPVARPNLLSKTPVEGTFGRYDGINVASDRNFNEIRARSQSTPQLIGKALGQMAGIAIGGTISTIGFLGDMPAYINRMVTGEDQPFERNAVSRAGHYLENLFFDKFEIYQTERAQNGAFNPFTAGSRLRDGTFWASMYPSIASTLSLMIPSYAVGRGLSMLARTAGAGQRTQRTITTIGAAVANRHNYNMLEGFDLMDRMQQRLIEEQGFSYLEAKKISARASSDFYATAYVNLWKDLAAWGTLLRGFNYASRNANQSIANVLSNSQSASAKQLAQQLVRNPSTTAKKMIQSSPYSWKDVLFQAGLEGFEEFNIQFQKSVYERNSDIILGLAEGDVKGFFESYFSEDSINALMTDKDIQNATLMGFFGGATFQGIGASYNKFRNHRHAAKQAEQAQQIEQSLNYMKDQLKIIENASAEGNIEAALQAEENLLTTMAFNSLTINNVQTGGSLLSGDLANNIEMFEAITQMDDATLSGPDFGFKNPQEVKEKAARQAQQLKEISKIFDGHLEKAPSMGFEEIVKAIQITEQEFLNKKAEERKVRLNNEINNYYTKTEIDAALKQLTPEQQQEVRQRARLQALRNLRKNKNDLTIEELRANGLNAYRFGILKRTRDKIIEKLDQEIKQIEESLPETMSKEVSNFIQNHLKNEKHNQLQNQNAINDYLIEEGILNLAEYGSKENAENILKILKSKASNINNQVFQYMVRKEATEGRYVKIDDKNYRISKKDDDIYIQEYNIETGKTVGEPKLFSGEDVQKNETEVANVEFFDADQIVPTDLKEKTIEQFNKELETNIEDALSTLEKIYFSGFENEYNTGINNLSEQLKKKLETFDDSGSMFEYVLELNNKVKSERLAQTINETFVEYQNKLAETYQKELNQLTAALSQEQKLLTKKQTELKEINKKIKEIKKKLKDAEIEQAKALLSEQYNQVISEKNTKVSELKEQGATALEINDVTKQYNEILRQKYEQALLENPQAQKEILNLREEIQQTLKDLRNKKRELSKKEQEIQKVVNTYNQILDKQNKTGIKTYILSQISSIEEAIKHNKLAAVMDSGYSLKSLRGKIANINSKIDQAIEELMLYDEYLETISNSNIVIKRARAAALAKILTSTFSIKDLDTLPSSLLKKYKEEFAKELTNRIKSTHAENTKNLADIVKLANEARKEILSSQDASVVLSVNVTPEVINRWEEKKQTLKSAIEALPNTLQDLQNLHLDHKILNDIISAMNSVVVAKTKPNTKEESSQGYDNNAPKRTLESLFQRFTGKDHIDNNMVSEEASIRYGQFVNSTNPATTNVDMKIVKYDDNFKAAHGLVMSKDVEKEYKNRNTTILLALPTDGKGGYYTMNGEVTDTFDPNINVYTSFPSTVSDLTFVQDENYLKKRYPKAKNLEEAKQLFQQDYDSVLEAHKKYTAEIITELDNGNEFFIKATGKNIGVPITDNNTSYSEGFVPTPIEEVVGSNFTLAVAKSDQMSINGITYEVQKGHIYAHNPDNGNLYKLERRRISKDEAETFLNLLRAYAQQQEIVEGSTKKKKQEKKTKPDEVPNLDFDAIDAIIESEEKPKARKGTSATILKEIEISGERINIFEYINDVFGSSLELKVTNNLISLYAYPEKDGKSQRTKIEFPLFKTDESGKLVNEFSESEGLKDLLTTVLHNVREKREGDYIDISVTEKGISSKEYKETESRSGYEQFLIEKNILGTRIKRPSNEVFSSQGGQQFTISSFQFMNQNFNFKNPYIKESVANKTNIVAKKEVSQNLKELINNLYTLTDGQFSEKRLSLIQHLNSFLNDLLKNPSKKITNLSEKYNNIVSLDTVEFGETLIPELDKKSDSSIKQYIAQWKEAHEAIAMQKMYERVTSEQVAEQIQKEIIGEGYGEEIGTSKAEEIGITKDEITSQTIDDIEISEKIPDVEIKKPEAPVTKPTETKKSTTSFFDSMEDINASLDSNQKTISIEQKEKIVRLLNDKLPFKTVILNQSETLAFIERLKEEGFLKEGQYVVNGVNYKGVAYVFSNAKLDTPFHEAAHPIISSILKDNPSLANNLTNEMLANEQYSKIYERVLETYPNAIVGENVNFNAIAEALTTILGIEAGQVFEAQSLGSKIWESIKEFFRNILNIPNLDIANMSPNTTLAEIGNILGATKRKIDITTELTSDVNFQLQEINDIFESNSELASIGTPEQYSQYLDTVFPDSQVKDVVHKGLRSMGKKSTHVTPNHSFYTLNYDIASKYKDERGVKSFKFDIRSIEQYESPFDNIYESIKDEETTINNSKVDAINLLRYDKGSLDKQFQLVINNKVNRLELGSQEDIQAFKEFVRDKQPVTPRQGIAEVFSENPELASIGTQEQYEKYLSTIFPDSKTKDIVYHDGGSGNIKKEGFDPNKIGLSDGGVLGSGFYFYLDRTKPYDRSRLHTEFALLNTKNPKNRIEIRDMSSFKGKIGPTVYMNAVEELSGIPYKETRMFHGHKVNNIGEQLKKLNIDAVVGSNEIVVFETNQIHILGSEQDIQGFKEFVNKKEISNIKTDSGKSISELGFNDKTWYLLSHNEQQNILRCK